MASGKRASMREGPLAALFRKTETEGLEGSAEAAAPTPPQPAAEPPRGPEARRVPPPQERLRHAFSSDLPENMLAAPAPAPPPASAADYQWSAPQPEQPGMPQLKVVGVGGGGVNAVNRMIEAEVPGV